MTLSGEEGGRMGTDIEQSPGRKSNPIHTIRRTIFIPKGKKFNKITFSPIYISTRQKK